MGKNAQGINPLTNPPRTVHSPIGEVLGVYFPVSRRVRLHDGRIFSVAASNLVQDGRDTLGVLDPTSLILFPLEDRKQVWAT